MATSGGLVYAGWCGPCNNQGFTRGIAVGHTDGTGWHQLTLPVDGTLPNRYVSGFDVDQADPQHVVVAINGFSRKWTEGPGAGIGHVFESRDAGEHWTDISANLPDIPAEHGEADVAAAAWSSAPTAGSSTARHAPGRGGRSAAACPPPR